MLQRASGLSSSSQGCVLGVGTILGCALSTAPSSRSTAAIPGSWKGFGAAPEQVRHWESLGGADLPPSFTPRARSGGCGCVFTPLFHALYLAAFPLLCFPRFLPMGGKKMFSNEQVYIFISPKRSFVDEKSCKTSESCFL